MIGDANAEKFFYHSDHVGSVRAVSNQVGQVVWKADYLAFGSRYGEEGVFEEERGFGGKELDSDTGLYYFNARWYDSELGRFISEDPEMDPNNPNLYSYCANNPINLIDPTGLAGIWGDSGPGTYSTPGDDRGSSSSNSSSGSSSSGSSSSNSGIRITTYRGDGSKAETDYYPDGAVESNIEYGKDGKIKKQDSYYSDGRIKSHTTYNDSGLIDTFIMFNANGDIESVILGSGSPPGKEEQKTIDDFKKALEEKRKEYEKTLSDPKLVAQKLKEWGEKRLVNSVLKGAISAAAVKAGLEVIKYSTKAISTPSSALGPGFRVVGVATKALSVPAAIGVSVAAAFVVDMIFPKPCY